METIEDTEYCPDCDVPVVYDDDGSPLCDCEWEEESGEAIAMETWLAQMKADGRETRQFDDAYAHLNRDGRDDFFVKKATFGQLHRIERLRWQCLINLKVLLERRHKLHDEIIAMPDKECFIPVDQEDLTEWKKGKDSEDPSTEDEIRRYSFPSRVNIEDKSRGDWCWINHDHKFFEYQKPKHSGTDMEVIAAATHLGEWEQEILSDRIQRSKDPAKLALGLRWRHLNQRERALFSKYHPLNAMLSLAVKTLGILPQGPDHGQIPVHVVLNGRRYPFKVGRCYDKAEHDHWPRPDDLVDVCPPETFYLDETLVGCRSDAVRARLGEPQKFEDDGRVWRYSEGAVVFSSHKDRYFTRVESISLTAASKEVLTVA